MKRILGLMLVLALFVTPCFAGQWDKDVPASTDQWTAFPAQALANNDGLDRLLSNYNTIKLSYSSATTIVASAGEVVVSNAAGSVRYMLKNTSSTNITFADIDTGSEASSTTYYVYAKSDSSADEDADFVISTSSSAPSGETYYKRLGSFYNNSSSNISFITNENEFSFSSPSSKTASTTYFAETDGFVQAIAYASGTPQQTQNTYMNVVSDSSSSPTTTVGRCYIENCSNCATGVWILACTVTAPIKAGDYYKATLNGNTTGSSITMNFIPIERD